MGFRDRAPSSSAAETLVEIKNDVKRLLDDLAPRSSIFRDSHLMLLSDKIGFPFATLVAACQEVADPSRGWGDYYPSRRPFAFS